MFRNLNIGALGLTAPLPKAIELAKMGGFEGVEFNPREIMELLKGRSEEEIIGLLRQEGLRWGGWGLPIGLMAEEEKFQRSLDDLSVIAETAHRLGCPRTYTWIAPYSDELRFEENFSLHVERISAVAEVLKKHGCVLGLEFVAPKTSRLNHKYEFIHDLQGIMDLIDAVGMGNLGVLLDSWHWYTSHGTVDQILSLRGPDVVYVHINDAPAGIPIDEQIDNVRCLPGETGVIDIVGFLGALRDIGYDGPVTPEPFDERLKRMPLDEAVLKVSEAVNKVWRSAGL
ncbi:MAG: Sugar phosphate isomerase/epimerase [Candidatus Bathyarchaeota archaeon B63]|nr:MAG: Sugar phosphate isomerase/epimerase [Candidatus Bathyarchaeota archaeon B63]